MKIDVIFQIGLSLGVLCKDCVWVLRRYMIIFWIFLWVNIENGVYDYKVDWIYI